MESQASSQANALPNTLLPRPPLPWPIAYQQQYPLCAHPIPYFSGPSSHGCYYLHWVYPHCIHAHPWNLAPPTCHKCPNILASPCDASSITSGFGGSEAPCSYLGCPRKAAGKPRNTSQVSAEKFSIGSSALPNIPDRSAAKPVMPTGDASLEVKCPTAQSPMAMHPSFCFHRQFTACPWSHGCWRPPCLLSMSHSRPPQAACPRAGPAGESSEVPDAEELEDGDDEPIFVLTDEYAEFFAKSEARRQEKKRQQRKEAKNLCRAAKFESEKQDADKNSPS